MASLGLGAVPPPLRPRLRAIAASWASRRLLPMPAAPSTTTTASAPSERRSSSLRTSASSASRPWNPRAGTVGIRPSRRAYPRPSSSFQIAGSCDAQRRCACGHWSSHNSTKGVVEVNGRPNIVLVHGAWADGSCWSGVIERLQADGFQVRAPQFPLTSLADDVARLRQVLQFQDGPTIVVGHSYGGQIATALGSDAPNVVGLVYIAAFGLDEGESLDALLAQGPVTPALAHLFTDSRGFGWLSEDDFVEHFAGDVEPTRARVLYAVQQPLASSALTDVMGVPAWKSLPSWYLVAQNDEAIPPDAERLFASRMGATTVEIPSSHVAMVSHPAEVADLIEKASDRVGKAAVV